MSVRLLESGPVRGDRPGREPLRLLDAARGLHALRRRGPRRRPCRARLARADEAAEAPLPGLVETDRATFETPYGHVERPANGDEEPGQSWVDVSGDGRGLTVITDSKYGYDVRGGDIGISAVRSPVWAWHAPRELEQDGDFEYMDLGRQTFLVRLVTHAGDWRDAGRRSPRRGVEPAAICPDRDVSRGPPAPAGEPRIGRRRRRVLSVLKGGEDGGYAVRAFETTGRGLEATLTVLGRTIEANFAPHEIKTFVLPRGGGDPLETDLLES